MNSTKIFLTKTKIHQVVAFLGSLGYSKGLRQPNLKFLFNPQSGILQFDLFLNALLVFDQDIIFTKLPL